MYHVKSDRRSQASAAEVVRGLQECLKTTPLKAVTVSNIHRVTGISRATFYRLFDTPEDVLIYQLDQMMETATATTKNGVELSPRALLETSISLSLQNHAFLKALVENGRQDLLFRYTEQSFHQLDGIRNIFPEEMEAEEREYVIAYLSMVMVASQIVWARNGQRENAGDMLRYLKRYTQVLTALLEDAEE